MISIIDKDELLTTTCFRRKKKQLIAKQKYLINPNKIYVLMLKAFGHNVAKPITKYLNCDYNKIIQTNWQERY